MILLPPGGGRQAAGRKFMRVHGDPKTIDDQNDVAPSPPSPHPFAPCLAAEALPGTGGWGLWRLHAVPAHGVYNSLSNPEGPPLRHRAVHPQPLGHCCARPTDKVPPPPPWGTRPAGNAADHKSGFLVWPWGPPGPLPARPTVGQGLVQEQHLVPVAGGGGQGRCSKGPGIGLPGLATPLGLSGGCSGDCTRPVTTHGAAHRPFTKA